MLMPQKTKFRKQQRGRLQGNSKGGNTLTFGTIGLQAVESGLVSARQIEAARKVITRTLKRGGKIWIRIFPDKPVTRRPAETRMGKGKGAVEFWAAAIKPGKILYEVDGIDNEAAESALNLAGYKLPIKTQVVKQSAIL